MFASLPEYRARKFRSLHAKRLESLCLNYGKCHGTVLSREKFQLASYKEPSFVPYSVRRLFSGIFSQKELLIFFCLGFFLLSIAMVLTSKLILLMLFPLILGIASLKNSRLKSRDRAFMDEYPAVLLATASNLKAGLSVYSALERAIQLLDDSSVTKTEIKQLLDKVARGISKEDAVRDFAKDIRLPELRLFKRAFLLVLVHGGKFSRTLERLSEVTRDRDSLIKSAKVSTASMRMTANVLLGMAPFLMFMLSLRTKNFWDTMFENSTAFHIAFSGAAIVFLSFYILRKLSDFKP